MTVSDAQKRAVNKWRSKNMKRIPLDVRIEEYEALKNYCDLHNLSINGFIRKLFIDAIGYNKEQYI